MGGLSCPWCVAFRTSIQGQRNNHRNELAAPLEDALREAIWGDRVRGGRGRTLEGILEVRTSRGPTPTLSFPDDYLRRTLIWLRHLDQSGLTSTEALRRHLGESELESPYQEAASALESALRNGSGATTKAAATKVLARCLSCAPKTVETARRRHGRSWIVDDQEEISTGQWDPPRYEVLEDHELVLPSSSAGSPRIFLNAEELEDRHPGAFDRFLELLEPTDIRLNPLGSSFIVKQESIQE